MYRYIILFLALLCLPLRANLGENVKQLVVRYGTPVSFSEATPASPFGTVVFQASGFTLMVFLLGDIEVGARVSKTDKTPLSDAEQQGIMGLDTAGSQWTSTASNDPTCLQWTRADSATVLYDKKKNMLIFTSDPMVKALQSFTPGASSPAPTSGAPMTTPALIPTPSGTTAPAK